MKLEITKICSIDEIRLLKNEWDELHSRCSYRSVFNSYDFLYSACTTYSLLPEENYFLLIRKSDNKKLIAIFPFCLTSFHWHRLKFKIIMYVGLNQADKPYPIIDEHLEEESWRLAIDYIKKDNSRWQFLELVEIREGLRAQQIMHNKFSSMGYYKKLKKDVDSPIVNLDVDWLDFWNKHKKMRQKVRRMKSDFGENMDFKVYSDTNTLEYCLKNYIKLEKRSWKAIEKIGISRSDKNIFFHKTFFRRLSEQNKLFFGFLYINKQLVSAEIAYTCDDTVYFSHGAYDDSYKKYSPGMVSTCLFLKYFLNSSYKSGDYLGGFASYMNHWASQVVTSKCQTIFRVTPKLIFAYLLGVTASITLRPARYYMKMLQGKNKK